jgi:hypothetical protein
MAYVTHSTRTAARHHGAAAPSLITEIALAVVLPRLSVAAERLSTREDMPAQLRQPRPSTKSKLRPEIDAASLWRSVLAYRETKAALGKRSAAELADFGLNQDDVADVALLTSFGWMLAAERPSPDTTRLARAKAYLTSLRRSLAPTDDELDEAYLAASSDLNDLEYRIREIDRRHRRQPQYQAGLWLKG